MEWLSCEVIKGWDVVAKTMAKGEKAIATLAPQYAYGETGSPPKIPPMATLKFELELVNWISVRDVFRDGGVIKAEEVEGEGWERPATLSEVVVDVVATLKEPSIDGAPVVLFRGQKEFALGAKQAPEAWEKVVKDMKVNGRVKLVCHGQYVRGPGVDFVPDDAKTVEYELTLRSWIKVDDLSEDGGVVKKVMKEGEGWEMPNEGALVTMKVAYRLLKNGKLGDVYEKHDPFMFKVSDGAVVDGKSDQLFPPPFLLSIFLLVTERERERQRQKQKRQSLSGEKGL